MREIEGSNIARIYIQVCMSICTHSPGKSITISIYNIIITSDIQWNSCSAWKVSTHPPTRTHTHTHSGFKPRSLSLTHTHSPHTHTHSIYIWSHMRSPLPAAAAVAIAASFRNLILCLSGFCVRLPVSGWLLHGFTSDINMNIHSVHGRIHMMYQHSLRCSLELMYCELGNILITEYLAQD